MNLLATGALTSLLPAMVGMLKAREMLLLGDQYDAEALQAMGLAWRVCDDEPVLTEALALRWRLPPLGGVL